MPAGHTGLGKKLSVIQTEYFDVIFAEESAVSARTIASCADDLYRKLLPAFTARLPARIPVLITRSSELLNAYFTVIPYNRIVLYDSVPPSSFAPFPDTLVSVFYHELVHALSLNVKSPFWSVFSRIAGDLYSPALMVNLPVLFVEGAAVFFESDSGAGRLNDGVFLHVIRQAKLENKFPDWRTAAGSYSAYTDGSLPYMFGAAFTDYIVKTYGSDLYAEFWKQSGQLHLFKLSAGIFKKVYGITLTQAWQDFERSFPTPPCETELPAPLFPEKSVENRDSLKGRKLYTSLTFADSHSEPHGRTDDKPVKSGGSFAWYDHASSSVWKADTDTDGKTIGTPVFLYTTDLKERLTFSRSGDFLVSSGISAEGGAKSCVSVYDVKKKKQVLRMYGLRGAAVVQARDGTYFLAGIERTQAGLNIALYDTGFSDTPAAYPGIPVYSAAVNTGKTEAPHRVHTIPLAPAAFPFDICDAGNGVLICLLKEPNGTGGFAYSLFFHNVQTGRSFSHSLPPLEHEEGRREYAAFHSLSVYNNTAFFSCSVSPFSQPVLAVLDLGDLVRGGFEAAPFNSVLSVQKTQYSGGVFSPAAFGGGVAFISRFYEHRRLSVFYDFQARQDVHPLYTAEVPAYSGISAECGECAPAVQNTATVGETEEKAVQKNTAFRIKPYNSAAYLKRGTVLPFAGFLNAAFFDRYAPDSVPLGISAFSGDPAERFIVAAGAGADPFTKNYNINGFTAATVKPFSFAAGFYTEAALDKLEKAAVKLHTGITLPAGLPFMSIHAANSTYFFRNLLKTPFTPAGYLFENKTGISIRYIKKTGAGVYETAGFSAGVSGLVYKKWDAAGNNLNVWQTAGILEAGVRSPFLIPFKNPRNFTLNFPFSLNAAYYINTGALWNIRSTFVLFSYNMQKPLPFIPLFMRSITVDGGGDCTFFSAREPLIFIHASLFSSAALNSGAATGVPFDFGITAKWFPPGTEPKNFQFSLKFNLKL